MKTILLVVSVVLLSACSKGFMFIPNPDPGCSTTIMSEGVSREFSDYTPQGRPVRYLRRWDRDDK
jgi:hypothetical protein